MHLLAAQQVASHQVDGPEADSAQQAEAEAYTQSKDGNMSHVCALWSWLATAIAPTAAIRAQNALQGWLTQVSLSAEMSNMFGVLNLLLLQVFDCAVSHIFQHYHCSLQTEWACMGTGQQECCAMLTHTILFMPQGWRRL